MFKPKRLASAQSVQDDAVRKQMFGTSTPTFTPESDKTKAKRKAKNKAQRKARRK